MFTLIDNYDSFTWNLWHFLSDLGAEVEIIRNDAATVVGVLFAHFARLAATRRQALGLSSTCGLTK